VAQAKAGQAAAALATATGLPQLRDSLLPDVITALAESGDYVAARQVAGQIGSTVDRDGALLRVEIARAQRGDAQGVLDFAASRPSLDARVRALVDAAAALLRSNPRP
jgi:hypothetical protein